MATSKARAARRNGKLKRYPGAAIPKCLKMRVIPDRCEFDESRLRGEELQDDYPVYADYIYVVDGRITRSDIQGTVRSLKIALIAEGSTADKVCRCDIATRWWYDKGGSDGGQD